MVRGMFGFVAAVLLLAMGATGAAAAPDRYVLPGGNVFPEGIAVQASTGDFFVGSTVDGAIYRGTFESPDVSLFLPGGGDGRTDARGLKVDNRGRLYVSGGSTGRLFVYDLASKRLLAQFATGLTPSFVNDAAITPNGDAYFTDSNSPAIYRVAADVTAANAFERIDLTGQPITYGMGFNLNGIAASGDGRYVLTVQSNTGKVFRLETATKWLTEVNLGGATVMGGDGMLLDGQTLHVMRNAAATLVTFRMAPDFASGTLATTTTNPQFAFPTTFGLYNGRLLVLNSQLDKRTAMMPPVLPFTVLNVAAPAVGGGTTSATPAAPAMLPVTGAARGAGDAMLVLPLLLAGGLVLLGIAMRVRRV